MHAYVRTRSSKGQRPVLAVAKPRFIGGSCVRGSTCVVPDLRRTGLSHALCSRQLLRLFKKMRCSFQDRDGQSSKTTDCNRRLVAEVILGKRSSAISSEQPKATQPLPSWHLHTPSQPDVRMGQNGSKRYPLTGSTGSTLRPLRSSAPAHGAHPAGIWLADGRRLHSPL